MLGSTQLLGAKVRDLLRHSFTGANKHQTAITFHLLSSHQIIVLRSGVNLRLSSIRFISIAIILFLPSFGIAQDCQTHRIELGSEITQIYLPVNPVGSVQYQPAIGGSAAFNIKKHFGIDSSISITPTVPISATSFAGGRLTQFFAGGRAGISKGRFRVYGKLRPGLVSFGSAITAVGPAPDFQLFKGRLTEFALDAGGIVEIGISKRFATRYELGDTIVRYPARHLVAGQPPVPADSTHNFQFGIGFLFLFH